MACKLGGTDKGDGMDTLSELGIKYGTDKIGKHNYLPTYYELFRNKSKRRKVKKVLEIGVAEGAGVRMFRDFFTNATIYGAEIEDGRIFSEDRIQIIKCDQSSFKDLLNLVDTTGRDLDLVIDDGSHVPEHQLYTCLQLLPLLPKGSIYIIEDVADEEVFKGIPDTWNKKMIRVGKRYDDRLIIIKL